MADRMTDNQAAIIGKSKAEVEALLGKPPKKSFWTNSRPPDGADPAAIAAFEAATLDEIWIYFNGRVHFSIAGLAKKVDDKTRFDLPPDQPGQVFV